MERHLAQARLLGGESEAVCRRRAEPTRVGPLAMKGGRLPSIGAVAFAFLASQHHNVMMLLLALGLGDTAIGFMTAAPFVRRVMLGLSLGMVPVIAYQMRHASRPWSTRVLGAVSIVATVGLSVWSVTQFGI